MRYDPKTTRISGDLVVSMSADIQDDTTPMVLLTLFEGEGHLHQILTLDEAKALRNWLMQNVKD